MSHAMAKDHITNEALHGQTTLPYNRGVCLLTPDSLGQAGVGERALIRTNLSEGILQKFLDFQGVGTNWDVFYDGCCGLLL